MNEEERIMKLKERIKDKIEETEKSLDEISTVEIPDIEEYLSDFKIKAICERYFEKIVEGIVDLTFLIIKYKKLKIPTEEEEAFFILANKEIISMNLAKKFKEAKGMRNIIVHKYGEIDDTKVHFSISEELIDDAEEFLECIKKII